MGEETTEKISVKSSDDILKELFSSIGTKDEEAAAGSQSDSSPSDSENPENSKSSSSKPKKAKKAKKDKKKKKKKDKKSRKDYASPKRKSRPLSPPSGPSRSSKEPTTRGIISLDEWQTAAGGSASRNGGRRSDLADHPRSPRHQQHDQHDRRDQDYRRSNDQYHEGGGGRRDYQRDVTNYDDRRDHQDRDHRRSGDHHDEGRRRQDQQHRDHRHGGGRDDHYDRRDRERRGSSRQETRPPKRSSSGQEDPFWDNRWEAMELQKKADAMVSKYSFYYLSNFM